MSNRAWPDGDDPVAIELRRALDEAQQRIPDDVTVRRGLGGDRQSADSAGRRAARLSWFAGGMASTAALALACAALAVAARRGRRPSARSASGHGRLDPALATPRRAALTLEGGVEAELQRTSVMRIEGSDAARRGRRRPVQACRIAAPGIRSSCAPIAIASS